MAQSSAPSSRCPVSSAPGSVRVSSPSPRSGAPARGRAIKIKGTTLLDSIAAARRREGEERYAAILALLDPELRRVFEGDIYDTSWYSLDAFTAFLDAGLRHAGDEPRVLTRRAEILVEQQLTGVYRVFVHLKRPEYVLQRLATIHGTYFSGTSVEVEAREQHAMIRYTGFEPQHWPLDYTLVGFYRKALELCGAKSVVAEMSVPISRGAPHSELLVSWRPALPNPA